MNLPELDLIELNSSEMKNIGGGAIGTILAVAGLVVTAYGVGLTAAYYKGYEDAKDACPPPPCKEL